MSVDNSRGVKPDRAEFKPMPKVVACVYNNRLVFDGGSSRGAMMATLTETFGLDV